MGNTLFRYPKEHKVERCTDCGDEMFYPDLIISADGSQGRFCDKCTLKFFKRLYPDVMERVTMDDIRMPSC